jgi:hypothetical protein
MCTVSVIPPSSGRGLRVVVNRDERRTRSLAWGPELAQRDGVPVIAPVDSESLGTWIAASGAGIVYALLNLNRDPGCRPRLPKTSRGQVIPRLAGAYDSAHASRRLEALDPDQFAPFRLVITDGLTSVLCQWNGARLDLENSAIRRPLIVSSSSLGDDLVESPRRTLFDALLSAETDPWRAQDRLHAHAWPDRRHLSVMMSRTDARTVSRTVIVMDGDMAAMRYTPIIDGWSGPSTNARLLRLRVPLATAG